MEREIIFSKKVESSRRREFVIRAADRDAPSGFIKTGSTDCKSAPAGKNGNEIK
jgi:hypothetical protein